MRLIERERVTTFVGVPTQSHDLLESPKFATTDTSSLQSVGGGGAAAPTALVKRIESSFKRGRPNIGYGMTEANACIITPLRGRRKTGSIGVPIGDVEAKIVDVETGTTTLPPGTIGELVLRCPQQMQGYWKKPDETAKVLRDGWLYTGDYASVDDEGFIYIRGRKSDMIKFMGHRISPLEIESAINSCPCVKESAAVETRQEGIPAIKAYIILEKECDLEDLKKMIHNKLPMYMRPQFYELSAALPRTENGKIKRSELRNHGSYRREICAE